MKYLCCLFPFLLLSCIKDEIRLECGTGIGVGQELTLPNGKGLELVRINDSRCPCNAICISAGYLQVEFSDGDKSIFVPEFPDSNNQATEIPGTAYEGYSITYTDVRVLVKCGTPLQQTDYCITFEIQG